MQGLFIEETLGAPLVRPKSKKEVKKKIRGNPHQVIVESTSIMQNDYSGPVASLPVSAEVAFVGPDPYNNRKFYGSIHRPKLLDFKVK